MKKLIVLVILHFLLSACSGTGQQGIVNVPGQNISFTSPPSNWLNLTKSYLAQFKKDVPEVVNMIDFMASWTNNNNSTITMIGTNSTEWKKEGPLRESLEYGINQELLVLEKAGMSGEYLITNEKNVINKGINFRTVEAEISYIYKNCKNCKKSKRKMIYYYFKTSNYYYLIEFRALDFYYDKDKIVFNKFFDSLIISDN